LRKGDTVKVLRGRFRAESAKVDVVDRRSLKVYLEGMKITKKDGADVRVPIDPSNLLITKLNLDDKMRFKTREVKKQIKETKKEKTKSKESKKSETPKEK
jgi:large subunit ribosomal protein L24